MSRTPLMRLMRKMLGSAPAGASGITRRRFVGGACALAGASILPPLRAAMAGETPRVAIIGGGLAGLTAAYRLIKSGLHPVIYEASPRFGGRVMTKYHFNADGQFCEMGGELIDSNHDAIINLCAEMGLILQNLRTGDHGEELYFFGGKWYAESDLIGKSGAFRQAAVRIAADAEDIYDNLGYSPKAARMDAMTLADYLARLRGKGTPGWVIDMLDVAYVCEYGQPTSRQSALNLIDFIGTDYAESFRLFGDSDMSWRIAGGSSRLTETLVNACKKQAKLVSDTRLTALALSGEQIACTLEVDGNQRKELFDRVIVTIPFTMMREVKGVSSLGLSPQKLRAIAELGYGDNAKIAFSAATRQWRDPARFKVPSNGQFYTDLPSQSFTESSRLQPGRHGILVNYLGGEAALGDASKRIELALADLAVLVPGIETAIEANATQHQFWSRHEWTRGSYACTAPGQLTGIMNHVDTPELGGRLLFAGEHTSANLQGYMAGAVESGNRAAREALGDG